MTGLCENGKNDQSSKAIFYLRKLLGWEFGNWGFYRESRTRSEPKMYSVSFTVSPIVKVGAYRRAKPNFDVGDDAISEPSDTLP